ncbi:UV-endonuclease UvdE [Dentipellis sp. KUC8613]|nr:UV-endonuclease UvdE [Dentipellis sp. KUC8613]
MVSKRTRTSTSTVQAPNAPSVVSASSEEAIVRRVSSRILAKKELEAAATPAAAELGSSSLTEVDNEPEAEPPVKKRRTRKAKDTGPVVYEIPPVESLATTYRGRLGYACLNTILRNRKPDSIFCSRTCRIATILKEGLDFAKNLGLQNAKDLSKLIQWNEENKIRFMRISSELFPFASHGKYGYSLDYAAAELKAAGDLAKSLGHRMTLHPGQFTQLASPKEDVVDASVRELEYHTSILRHMGLGKDSMIIIHMGGVYGDKPTTLARFKENYTSKLSDEMKARVVLENDEMCYNADDLLPVCEEFNIPIVFDYHHNWLYPSVHPLSELLPRINALWHRKGIRPKQHLSSPRPGAETLMERRAHAGRCKTLPAELELEGAGWYWGEGASEDGQRKKEWVDLMIEAKDKEQAVFQLYRTYGLEPVIWENLRPEKADAKEEGSPSKGRRTRKKGDSSYSLALITSFNTDFNAQQRRSKNPVRRTKRTRSTHSLRCPSLTKMRQSLWICRRARVRAWISQKRSLHPRRLWMPLGLPRCQADRNAREREDRVRELRYGQLSRLTPRSSARRTR